MRSRFLPIFAVLLVLTGSGGAASYLVSNTADAGPGSLRQAILDANATAVADVITFAPGVFSTPQTIALSSGELSVTRGLTVEGPGAGVTLDAGGASRVMAVTTPGADPVRFEKLSFVGGGGVSNGAGLRVIGGAILEMEDCVVSGCVAAGDGGGILLVNTDAFLFNCTVLGNRCGDDGGGLHLGGISSDVLIAQSTIAANRADDHGGGVFNTAGALHLLNVTITDNDTDFDADDTGSGAAHNHASGTVKIENTIVAGNRDRSPTLVFPDVAKVFATARFNLIGIGDGSASFVDGVSGNIVGDTGAPVDAGLGGLDGSSALTPAFPLCADSPARDAADAFAPSFVLPAYPPFDQLGQTRAVNAALDIGATEFQGETSPASTVAAGSKYAYAANGGWVSLREDGVTPAAGVVFGESFLSGAGYAANFGWINFGDGSPANGYAYANTSAGDFGVNHDGVGNLSGHAYGANVGYINFGWASAADPNRPRVDLATGAVLGYAYSANMGWLNLGTGDLAVASLYDEDSDLDGIGDGWEFLNFGDLLSAGRATDADGDDQSDAEEYLGGSDPNDGAHWFNSSLIAMSAARTEATVEFSSHPGREYRIEISDGLGIAPDVWRDSGLGTFSPDVGASTVRTFDLPGGQRQFFRIVPSKPLQ